MKTLRECFENFDGRLLGKIDHFFEDYEAHLRPFVGTPVNLLEIGVHGGGSLELWRQYFGNEAIIHGLDIDSGAAERAPADCHVHIGDQGDRDTLQALGEDYGPFDLVIDDGSHMMGDQIASFEVLYPLMSSNGVYICEDSFTSYWREYGGNASSQITFIEYAKQLIDELHAFWRLDEDIEATDFTANTRAIHFYSGAVVFQREAINPPSYVVRNDGRRQQISAHALKQAAARQLKGTGTR